LAHNEEVLMKRISIQIWKAESLNLK